MNNKYKTVEEILHLKTLQKRYFKAPEQLFTLALTKYAENIEKEGGIILSAHPVISVTENNTTETPVIGSYIKYTYKKPYQYYIQFDSNPFFPPKGYIQFFNNNHITTTGITNLPQIWQDIDPYNLNEEAVNKLTENINKAIKYLTTLSFIHKTKIVPYKDNWEQTIYTF